MSMLLIRGISLLYLVALYVRPTETMDMSLHMTGLVKLHIQGRSLSGGTVNFVGRSLALVIRFIVLLVVIVIRAITEDVAWIRVRLQESNPKTASSPPLPHSDAHQPAQRPPSRPVAVAPLTQPSPPKHTKQLFTDLAPPHATNINIESLDSTATITPCARIVLTQDDHSQCTLLDTSLETDKLADAVKAPQVVDDEDDEDDEASDSVVLSDLELSVEKETPESEKSGHDVDKDDIVKMEKHQAPVSTPKPSSFTSPDVTVKTEVVDVAPLDKLSNVISSPPDESPQPTATMTTATMDTVSDVSPSSPPTLTARSSIESHHTGASSSITSPSFKSSLRMALGQKKLKGGEDGAVHPTAFQPDLSPMSPTPKQNMSTKIQDSFKKSGKRFTKLFQSKK